MISLVRPRHKTDQPVTEGETVPVDNDTIPDDDTSTEEQPAPDERTHGDEPLSDSDCRADATHNEVDDDHQTTQDTPSASRTRRMSFARVLAFGVLPALVLGLAAAAGFLRWQDSSVRDAQTAAIQAVQAATDSTIKMLSYRPDTVEKDLSSARDRLTGTFRDSYTSLTQDVVIPGAKQKQISAVATVPAAAPVSASPNHAVVLVLVNQTIVIGSDPPSSTASSVRVTLDKQNGRWLISGFDPI